MDLYFRVKVIGRALAPLWCGIICYLSLTHISPSLEHAWWHIPNLDKYVHIILYAVLSGLLYVGFTQNFVLGFISSTGYGLLMEYFQKWFTTWRSFEWADLLADAAGAILGYLCIRWAAKQFLK